MGFKFSVALTFLIFHTPKFMTEQFNLKHTLWLKAHVWHWLCELALSCCTNPYGTHGPFTRLHSPVNL